MDALILAAGLGTRLKPFTDNHPKALFPIGDTNLLEHNICKLEKIGCSNIIINLHHFGNQIIEFINSRQWKANILFSDESSCLLETGGAIKKAAPLFSSNDFLIHNVDILSNADIESLYKFYKSNDADAALLVSNRDSSRKLLFEGDNLKGWCNLKTNEVKPSAIKINTLNALAFSGIHILSRKIVEYMQPYPERFSITDFYINECCKLKIKGFNQDNLTLFDVGKAQTAYEAINYINL